MSLSFTKMIIASTESKRTRDIITSSDWNNLFNLNIAQGNHSENALEVLFSRDILNYDITTVVNSAENKVPTSKAVLEALGSHGLGDMLHEYYDADLSIKTAGGIKAHLEATYRTSANQDIIDNTIKDDIDDLEDSMDSVEDRLDSIEDILVTVPVAKGGTGATTAAVARANLDAQQKCILVSVTLESGNTEYTPTVEGIDPANVHQSFDWTPSTDAGWEIARNCGLRVLPVPTVANQVTFKSATALTDSVPVTIRILN